MISEAHDDVDMAAGLLAAAASGQVTDLITNIAVRTSDAMKAMEKAKRLVDGCRTAGTNG